MDIKKSLEWLKEQQARQLKWLEQEAKQTGIEALIGHIIYILESIDDDPDVLRILDRLIDHALHRLEDFKVHHNLSNVVRKYEENEKETSAIIRHAIDVLEHIYDDPEVLRILDSLIDDTL